MSKVVDSKIIHKSKWLTLNEIKYETSDGKTRTWESVSRSTKTENHDVDAVCVVPILSRALHHNCFVMVKQFRPPLQAYTLEFPAGLIDKEDPSIEKCALRELYEETGYTGKITDVLDHPTALDPGVLGTTIVTVVASINGDDAQNLNPTQHLDEGEFVDVLLLPVNDFYKHLCAKVESFTDHKVMLDSRVLSFATGLRMGESFANQRNYGIINDDSPLDS